MLQFHRRFIIAFSLGYIAGILIYGLSLYISFEGNSFELSFVQTAIKYVWKAIWTIPIIWWVFVHWRDKPLLHRLLVHVLACPIWLVGWLVCYQWTSRIVGINYLSGRGMIWDIFIPFLFYVVQFAILHAYEYHKRLIWQQKREKELLETLHLAQLSSLKAQLQPHFLFNTLNSISASVPPESEHTRQLIAQLADTCRSALYLSKHDFVPLAEEIKFVKICLDLEHERFGDRLSVSYKIPPSVLHHKIPSMLLQPLVENALKHGIAPQVEGGSIHLTIKELDGFLHFEIADTGKGLSENPQNTEGVFERGVGLKNTALRLEKLYNERIILEKNEPQGLKVIFKIPVGNV